MQGGGSKFGEIDDVPCKFQPKFSQIILCWALKLFIVWKLSSMFCEEDKIVDHSSVNCIVKNRFPPSHASPVHTMGCHNLIGIDLRHS